MQKKLLILLCQMLSVVCAGLMLNSCSGVNDDFDIDNNGVEVLSPIKSYDLEINNFFESEIQKFFIVDTIHDQGYEEIRYYQEDKSYIVNSADELLSIYKGAISLPDIDFDKYTLLLVTVYVPGSQYNVKTQLVAYDTYLQLNVYVKPVYKDGEAYLCAFENKFYWLLYPKIAGTDIKVLRKNL